MRSIAWVFSGIFLLGVFAGPPETRADDLNIINNNSGGKGRGKSANTGNSNRGYKEFGFFAEPSLGFAYGKFSGPATTAATTLTDSTLTGPVGSGLLGAVFKSYFAAMRLDYALLSNSTNDFSLGVEVGTTLGSSPVRFYGAFNFIDNLASGGRTFSSDSFIIGASYYFTKKFVANLEYHFRSYGSITQGGIGLQPSFSNVMLTISLPLMFSTPSMPDLARTNSNDLKEVGGSMGEWNI